MPDITLTTLQSLKLKGEKITMLTCYDAYSREEGTGSQLDVLPHCYEGGVTRVTDAIQPVDRVLAAQEIKGGSWLACDSGGPAT